MKLEIKTNFDFGKMADQLPKVIDKFLNDSYAGVVAQDSKKFIESGRVSPPLKESTVKKRLRDGYGTKPLYRTGDLANSISKSKNGLEMKGYGTLHHKGFVWGKSIDPRPFLQVNNLSRIISKFFDALKTARKK
jgi:hypothetical protein